MNVTINDVEIESEDPKAIRKAINRAKAAERKAEAERQANSERAMTLAQAKGYRVLSRKASGEAMLPHAWRFYAPGDKWAEHVFNTNTAINFQTLVKADPPFMLNHYSRRFYGAVCDGSGYAMLVFLQDVYNNPACEIQCYAVAAVGSEYALAECPGITPDDFARDRY